MVGKIIVPDNRTLSMTIPQDMVGREVKIIAYVVGDEAEVMEDLAAPMPGVLIFRKHTITMKWLRPDGEAGLL